MKLDCPCGETIVDTTDDLPYKGHILGDQDFHPVWESIREAMYSISKSPSDVDELERDTASKFIRKLRGIWQCQSCGRVAIDDAGCKIHWFKPEDGSITSDLLVARISNKRL